MRTIQRHIKAITPSEITLVSFRYPSSGIIQTKAFIKTNQGITEVASCFSHDAMTLPNEVIAIVPST